MTEDPSWFAARDHRDPFAVGEDARSWGDFLADAERLSGRIRSLSPGTRPVSRELMVACGDRYHCAVSLLAIWSTGGVAALPPHGRPETVDGLCGERGISWVLHDGGGERGLDVRTVIGRYAGDAGDAGDAADAASAAQIPKAAMTGPSAPLARPSWDAAHPLACLYTSGSTGAHVACVKTAGQLLGEAQLLVKLFELGTGTRVLATVPPHHIYGLLFGVLVPMVGGGAFVRTTPHHAETIAAEAARWEADVLCSVPAHLRGLTILAKDAFPPLRRVFSSAGPLATATATEIARLHGKPVVEIFGSSETGGIAWRERAGGAAEPWWRPLPGIAVDVDADGILLLRSPFVVAPPQGEPYRTADRIALGPDGGFTLLGRADGIVKIGGSRVSLAEVERILTDVPGVREAAVLSVDVASSRQQELWAVVVSERFGIAELRAALLRRLEPIALPRRFRLVSALPRETDGKLVRERLLALFGPDDSAGAHAPVSADNDEFRAELTVSPDSPVYKFFEGHFRNFAVLPGVVQLNNLVLQAARERWPALRRLERVLSLKFRSPIRPGERLVIHLTRGAAQKVAFEIRRADEVVSSGVLHFSPPAG